MVPIDVRPNDVRPSRGGKVAKLAVLGLAGLACATAAFAQSAARVNFPIGAFSGLSPSFYAVNRGLVAQQQAMLNSPTRARAAALRASALRVAAAEPLSRSAWRSLGLAANASGNANGARTIMRAADRMSRRDAAVQVWLIEDGIRRGQVAETLAHFDVLMRTKAELRDPLAARLATVIGNRDARRELVRFVRDDNIWFERFNLAAASQRGSIVPYAQLLLAAEAVPANAIHQAPYAAIVNRLAMEGEFDLLRRLYPKLPGAEPHLLTSIAFGGAAEPLYPPIGWAMAEEPERGAELVASDDGGDAAALEAFADPVTDGLAAVRLVWVPGGARALRWRVVEREGASDASATVRVRCGSTQVASPNQLARGAAAMVALPAGCRVARVELSLYGGTGRDQARLVMDRMTFASSVAAPAANAGSAAR